MRHTLNDVLRVTTLDYLQTIQPTNPPPPSEIEEKVLDLVSDAIRTENTFRQRGEKWRIPERLSFSQIADIMAYLYPIRTVCTGDTTSERQYDLLAVYKSSGPNEGIYVTDEEEFRNIARQYNYSIKSNEFEELLRTLRNTVPRVKPTREKNLIAVNNGIYDYDKKVLMPFSPDYVFLSKSTTNYVDNPPNPIIYNKQDGTEWDVESWINTLSTDTEVQQLLREIIGAVLRPNVPWNKSAWFYSEQGNNGKGTFCELLRNVVGNHNCTSIALSEMGKDFALEPLIRSSAIIVDENDVGTFVDKAANLKAIITGDVVQINRKFKTPIPYKFKGFMVQCLNEMPRVKDKSDSFYRRQLFIPFLVSFKGQERKYIKDDYLKRPEVLEYVLYKALHDTNFYELSEPQVCRDALSEYKEYNDPTRQFAIEILPEVKWDFLPWKFLYDLYKAWFSKNIPNGTIQKKLNFKKDLYAIAKAEYPEWCGAGIDEKVWIGKRMNALEPLIHEYDLTEWMAPGYSGKNTTNIQARMRVPVDKIPVNTRGLLRITSEDNASTDDEDSEEKED